MVWQLPSKQYKCEFESRYPLLENMTPEAIEKQIRDTLPMGGWVKTWVMEHKETPFLWADYDLLNAEMDIVEVGAIVAPQPWCRVEKIIESLYEPYRHGYEPDDSVIKLKRDYPYLGLYDGDYYILDGLHRVTARILLGNRKITAYVVDYNAP